MMDNNTSLFKLSMLKSKRKKMRKEQQTTIELSLANSII